MTTSAAIWGETRAIVARHLGVFVTLAAACQFLPTVAMRLLAPQVATMPSLTPGAAPPPAIPASMWLVLLGITLVQYVGLFTIAAITSDPREGGGRTIGETIAAALPAFGKFLLALVLFAVAYLVFSLVAGIVLAILAIVFGATGGMTRTSAGTVDPQMIAGLVGLIIAVVLPLVTWVMARLSPLVGVYLREDAGVVAGIRRAWSLSRGSTWSVVLLLLLFLLLSGLAAAIQFGLGSGGVIGILGTLVAAAISAILFVYFSAAIGVIYGQVATPPEDVFA